MAILVIGFSIFMYFNNKNKPISSKKQQIKTTKDELESLVKEQVRTIQDNYINQIETLKKEKSSLQNKCNRLEGLYNKLKSQQYDDETEDDESIETLQQQYEIVPEKAIEMAKRFNLNPAGLQNPALMPMVWEQIKANQDLAILLGVIRPKGMGGAITQTVQPANSYEALLAELQTKGQFA